jgi:hypothetical protein
MKDLSRLAAFAVGCITAAFGAWIAVDVEAQSDQGALIHVCVASDRVMRLAQAAQCPSGEKDLYFRKAGGAGGVKRDNSSESDRARIATLEERIRNLEESANRGELGNKVKAPFEVTDRDGKRILRVTEERKVELYNGDGKIVAGLVASESGGRFVALSSRNDLTAGIGAFEKYAGMRVNENGSARIDLGRDDEKGTYRLKVFAPGDALVAAVGQSAAGTGIAIVGDTAGTIKASMLLAESKRGTIRIENSNGLPLAELTEGAHGGLLQITNSSGEPMVDAGVEPGGFGVVRAGPAAFKSGFGLLGLPGSYIAGKPQ